MISYAMSEIENLQPAKTGTIDIPSKAVIRETSFSYCGNLQMVWDSKGDYLAVIAQIYKKVRKAKPKPDEDGVVPKKPAGPRKVNVPKETTIEISFMALPQRPTVRIRLNTPDIGAFQFEPMVENNVCISVKEREISAPFCLFVCCFFFFCNIAAYCHRKTSESESFSHFP